MAQTVTLSSIDTIFDKLGGPSAVARALNIGTSTASEMKRRRSIPVKYWPALIKAPSAKKIGLNETILMSVHAAPAPSDKQGA